MENENISKLEVTIWNAFVSDKDQKNLDMFNTINEPLPTITINIDGAIVFEKKLEHHGSPLLRDLGYGGFITEVKGRDKITMDISVKERKLRKTIKLDLSKGLFINIYGAKNKIRIDQKKVPKYTNLPE